MKDHLLEIENLHFSYGTKQVLSGLSLNLEEGEVLCLLGPNGCGKTTLLDCILKILTPASGTLSIMGKNQKSLSPQELAKITAYVPQKHSSHFPFTVSDFVLMGRTPYTGLLGAPGKKDRELVHKVLLELGLEALQNKDYSRLSGGEARMVLIARALVQEAPLLIMDEPGSHLDYRNEILMLETILTLVKNRKRSVLMSTHSPNQVFFLENCGLPVRAAILQDGVIQDMGKPMDILTPEKLKKVYGVRTALVNHMDGDHSINNIIPIPSNRKVNNEN